MSAHDDRYIPDPYIPDPDLSETLQDVGGGDLWAIVAVGPDGDTQMLVGTLAGGQFSREVPAHEQNGPLPSAVAARINDAVLRCGRPTKSGRPCRQRVNVPGNSCPMHAPHKEAPAALQRDRSE